MTEIVLRENWDAVVPHLCGDFPYLDPTDVQQCQGDAIRLTEHLADTHHLTLSEARESLSDWMVFAAPALQSKAA